ncbi:hypothetical protein WDU94_000833 [Cyamophila willieti]
MRMRINSSNEHALAKKRHLFSNIVLRFLVFSGVVKVKADIDLPDKHTSCILHRAISLYNIDRHKEQDKLTGLLAIKDEEAIAELFANGDDVKDPDLVRKGIKTLIHRCKLNPARRNPHASPLPSQDYYPEEYYYYYDYNNNKNL